MDAAFYEAPVFRQRQTSQPAAASRPNMRTARPAQNETKSQELMKMRSDLSNASWKQSKSGGSLELGGAKKR